MVLCQRSDRQKKVHVETSVELRTLLDQYSELQFEGIAVGDESWVCCLTEFDSMFAHRLEKVIPRLRPRTLIKKVIISVFFTARQFIAVDAFPKRQKYNQEYFVHNIFPLLLNEKKRFSGQKTAINYLLHMDNSTRQIRHQVVDEFRGLKILRAPPPAYSSGISPCNF
jgi:hypothetical protein